MESTVESRLERVLRMLLLLQSGMQHDTLSLSRDLGVSRRTIFRDIALLRSSGMCVRFEEETGRYAIPGGPIVAGPDSLDSIECLWLSVASRLSMLSSSPTIDHTLQRGAAKLLCSLPLAERQCISSAAEAFEVTTPAVDVKMPSIAVVQMLVKAIGSRRQLRITVDEGESRLCFTSFSPYRIVVHSDRWTINGRSSAHNRAIDFDAHAILEAQLTDDVYAIPRHAQAADDKAAVS